MCICSERKAVVFVTGQDVGMNCTLLSRTVEVASLDGLLFVHDVSLSVGNQRVVDYLEELDEVNCEETVLFFKKKNICSLLGRPQAGCLLE